MLVWLGLSAVLAAGWAWTARRALAARWLGATLGRERAGPLAPGTLETLRATVTALLTPDVETGHYLEAFRWRAAHVRGARALYERFADAMDRAARRHGAPDFRRAPLPLRRRLLATLRDERGATRARRALGARDEARFARHIVRDVFRRFARTDAWVLAGYDAWPGMPRAIARFGPPREGA